MLVLAGCLAGVQLGAQSMRLHDVAASGARALARGESIELVRSRSQTLLSEARVTRVDRGELVCVEATAPGAGPYSLVRLSASSCSLGGGR